MGSETWEIEEAPWEASLASVYREALREAPSRVLERCIDRLEAGALDEEEDFLIVEDIPPTRWQILGRQWLAGGFDLTLLFTLTAFASRAGGPGWADFAFGGIAAFVYLTLGAFLGGRTLGDRLAGIRLEAPGGERLGLGQSALRALLAMLGILSVVGLFWPLVDGQGQSLHDRILGARLVPAEADQP